jgi:hypothetical protein
MRNPFTSNAVGNLSLSRGKGFLDLRYNILLKPRCKVGDMEFC